MCHRPFPLINIRFFIYLWQFCAAEMWCQLSESVIVMDLLLCNIQIKHAQPYHSQKLDCAFFVKQDLKLDCNRNLYVVGFLFACAPHILTLFVRITLPLVISVFLNLHVIKGWFLTDAFSFFANSIWIHDVFPPFFLSLATEARLFRRLHG